MVGGRALLSPRSHDEPLSFSVPPPSGVEFAEELRDVTAISPDGREIVFAGADSAGRRRLWVRALSATSSKPIDDTDAAYGAFWAPDGSALGFFRGRQLYVLDRRRAGAD